MSTAVAGDDCDWLVGHGVCTGAALQQARALSAENGDRIPRALTKLGFVSEGRLAKALAEEFGLELLVQWDAAPDLALGHPYTHEFLRARWAVPLRRDGDNLVVAVADPTDKELQRSLEFGAGASIRRIVATFTLIESEYAGLFTCDSSRSTFRGGPSPDLQAARHGRTPAFWGSTTVYGPYEATSIRVVRSPRHRIAVVVASGL